MSEPWLTKRELADSLSGLSSHHRAPPLSVHAGLRSEPLSAPPKLVNATFKATAATMGRGHPAETQGGRHERHHTSRDEAGSPSFSAERSSIWTPGGPLEDQAPGPRGGAAIPGPFCRPDAPMRPVPSSLSGGSSSGLRPSSSTRQLYSRLPSASPLSSVQLSSVRSSDSPPESGPWRCAPEHLRRSSGRSTRTPGTTGWSITTRSRILRLPRDSSGTSAARIEAGIPPIRFHDLRYFCATQLLEEGLDHFAVSVQLGHEDGGALVMARDRHPSKDAARERLLGPVENGVD